MPNWCGGCVTVSGKPKNVKAFCKRFIFEEDVGNETKKGYFARSFIHSKWSWFEDEYFTKENMNEKNLKINFCVDFAWSACSCLIEGYPQKNKRICLTLKQACKKHRVEVAIDTEEPGICFEEEIYCSKKGKMDYLSKKMPYYKCEECGIEQAISSQSDLEDYECYNCGQSKWRYKMDNLIEAEDSRYKCTCCGGKINKGEKYFRSAKSSGMRFSHTVNICVRCLTKLFLKINMSEEEVNKIRDEIMLSRIEQEE